MKTNYPLSHRNDISTKELDVFGSVMDCLGRRWNGPLLQEQVYEEMKGHYAKYMTHVARNEVMRHFFQRKSFSWFHVEPLHRYPALVTYLDTKLYRNSYQDQTHPAPDGVFVFC